MPFWNLFLSAHLLLLTSFAAFTGLRRVLAWLGLRAPHQQLVRWGQALVLLSLLSPFALALLPVERLPELRMPDFSSASESGSGVKQIRGSARRRPVMLFPAKEKVLELVTALQDRGHHPEDYFLPFWLLGVLFFSSRLFREFRKLSRLLSAARQVRKIGRVAVLLSAQSAVPISASRLRRHWVILPEGLLPSRRDFKIALMHEVQHLRQGDTLWAVAVELIACFFYGNPALYAWKRQIVELQEFSCDETLVGQRGVAPLEYGSCLVRVAEAALGKRETYAGTAYMAAHSRNPHYFKSFLRRRIEMLVDQRKARCLKWAGASIGTVAVLFTLSLAYGAERSERNQSTERPNRGEAVVDEKIQKIAERMITEALEAQNANEAFAIVAEPSSGRILAVADVVRNQKGGAHRVLAQQLEPASIAKSLVVAEAIEQEKTTPEESHNCEHGTYKFADRVFHDWKKQGGFDHLTTTETIARSSDICALKIAEKIGIEGVSGMLEKYGIGPGGTASVYPGAKPGRLPPKEGPLHQFLVPYVAYGQGFRVTPLELVQAYGAIANGGELLMPIQANASATDRKVVRRVLSQENSEKMKRILREVVLSGTGMRNAASALYSTAGKTASHHAPDLSDFAWNNDSRKPNMAGFIGFAPVSKPRVEVYVGIRDPHTDEGGAHGSAHAAPVFRKITDAVMVSDPFCKVGASIVT